MVVWEKSAERTLIVTAVELVRPGQDEARETSLNASLREDGYESVKVTERVAPSQSSRTPNDCGGRHVPQREEVIHGR